jgi:hypothetical protein
MSTTHHSSCVSHIRRLLIINLIRTGSDKLSGLEKIPSKRHQLRGSCQC